MSRDELDFAIDLAAKEGWNPGMHDADCFYKTDPEGFLIGTLGDRPMGCISAISYEGMFGFIGFYIVLPEYRGMGYGIQLWNAAIQRLKGHNIGLDGVVEQQKNYEKSGFRLAYGNIRYEGHGGLKSTRDERISNIAHISFDKVKKYDRQFFPADRTSFLKAWLNMPESRAVAYTENDMLCGYGVIRKCRRGYKIGPLFADNEAIAEKLFLILSGFADIESSVFLDVPEMNRFALSLANKYGMKKVFSTARMYTREEPEIPLDRLFGVTTFELG